MAAYPVCKSIEKHRPSFLQEYLFLSLKGINYCKRIISVNSFCMHHVGINTCTNPGKNSITHCFPHGLSSHPVEVIHKVENEWQTSFILTFPESIELVHRGKCNSFPYRPATHRGITDVTYHDPWFPVYFFIKSSTD